MSEQQKKHQIVLKTGAVKYLRDMLAGTGWAKTTSDIILGGRLLVDVVPENTEPPIRDNGELPADFKKRTVDWSRAEMAPFECTQKEYDAVRKAIDHFVGQGVIPPSAPSQELLAAFGYSPE